MVENVTNFDIEFLKDLLHGHYVVIEIVRLSPSDLGWASARPRIFIILVHVSFMPKLMNIPHPLGFPNLNEFIVTIFSRMCSYCVMDYFIANDEELQCDIDWARGRTSVTKQKKNYYLYSLPINFTEHTNEQ